MMRVERFEIGFVNTSKCYAIIAVITRKRFDQVVMAELGEAAA